MKNIIIICILTLTLFNCDILFQTRTFENHSSDNVRVFLNNDEDFMLSPKGSGKNYSIRVPYENTVGFTHIPKYLKVEFDGTKVRFYDFINSEN